MTASEYRYVRAIEQIKREKGRVIMTDIAEKLSFARASVYKKLLSLEQQGIVAKEDGKYVVVTPKGEAEYRDVSELVGICAVMLADNTRNNKKFLGHDAVNMACALSARCKNALIANFRS